MKSLVYFAGILSLTALLMLSCNKEENETNISKAGGNNSHNMGQNCMNCHKKGGEGKGQFTAAGTVYDENGTQTYPQGTVKLYTGPNGTGSQKASIAVDGKGNFYTTETIDFGSGLYPSLTGATTTFHMGSKITNGQCNSCHGVSTSRLMGM